jgi:hypothetical protein
MPGLDPLLSGLVDCSLLQSLVLSSVATFPAQARLASVPFPFGALILSLSKDAPCGPWGLSRLRGAPERRFGAAAAGAAPVNPLGLPRKGGGEPRCRRASLFPPPLRGRVGRGASAQRTTQQALLFKPDSNGLDPGIQSLLAMIPG